MGNKRIEYLERQIEELEINQFYNEEEIRELKEHNLILKIMFVLLGIGFLVITSI